MTEIVAYSKYLRVSPSKVRLVVETIEGLSPAEALAQLEFLRRAGARPLSQTLKSALANAENNLKLEKENLRIKKIEVSEGPRLKRWRPVSRGMAHPYQKRTTHIRVVLEEVVRGTKGQS